MDRYKISGRVKNRLARIAVVPLRVEAWDKDLIVDDFVGSAETGADGVFTIEFEAAHFSELFADRRPDLFFRVYSGSSLVASTEDSVLWNLSAGETPVEIAVDLPGSDSEPAEPAVTWSELHGRVVAASSDRPLWNYRVHGELLDDGNVARDLGYALTDRLGLFRLRFPERVESKLDSKEKSDAPVYRFALSIWNPAGKQIAQPTVQWRSGSKEPLRIELPDPQLEQPGSPQLADLARQTSLELPAQLLAALDKRGLKTLADLRRAGGLSRLEGLPVSADHPAVAALDAHVHLSVLTPDVRTNAQMIQRGYTSVERIAAAPRAEFVATMQAAVGDARAYALHGAAEAQAGFIDNLVAGVTVSVAAGTEVELADLGLDLERFLGPCHCEDCEAAVSPLAYLADLLDYTLRKATDNGALTLAGLTQRFYQPFGDLPASCAAMDEPVRQVRICIEMLRAFLAENPPLILRRPALLQAESNYRREAYFRLLSELGVSYDALRLALDAPGESAERLAERLGVAANRLGALRLNPDTVTEVELEAVFGLRRSTRSPLQAVPVSTLQSRRLEYLAQLWHQEDWPNDSPPAGRPLIDPDLIGPDDFRSPILKANAIDPDRAFDVWERRRRWIDARLQELTNPANAPQRNVRGQAEPDWLAAMFAIMALPAGYAGVQSQPWTPVVPIDQFDVLAYDLSHGTSARIAQVQTMLRNELALDIEAFNRLQVLRDKDRRWVRQAGGESLSETERRELASILTQSMKVRFFQAWRDEEQQAQIDLSLGGFWFPEREPVEGAWPPLGTGPWIEPELIALRQLPEWLAGDGRAAAIWQARRAELTTVRLALRATRENQGLDAAIDQALGDPNSPLPDLVALRRSLDDPDPNVVAQARQALEQRVSMPPEAFERFMEIYERSAAANNPAAVNPPSPPTESDWAEAYAILVSAHKRYRLYSAWRDIENDPLAPLPYWFALKAMLPRWRADAVVRSQWQAALRVRQTRPLIDPDVIGPADFVAPYSGRPTYDVYRARRDQLQALQSGYRATRQAAANALAGLDAICRDALGHDSQRLLDFAAAEQGGLAITARLSQLSINRANYDSVLRARRLIEAGDALLPEHWSEIEAALTLARKCRLSAGWREQERAAGITLRPALFRLAPEDALTASGRIPGSRSEPAARRAWRAQLAARIEQQASIVAALAASLSSVEEALLPSLRDALIGAANVAGPSVEARGKALADRLLIETRASGCQMTTRISQAITTIQLLLWSVRTGQLHNTYPNLQIDDDRFDERWQWIGSYVTWRAAVFVHLYPENLLMPALRRAQSPGFVEFLRRVRQDRRRIAPDNACRWAERYAEYYRDIAGLEVQASCHARTNLSNASCGASVQGGERILTYFYGRSASGRCYWSHLDTTVPSSQSLWAPIPGFEKVAAILGAVLFVDRDGRTMVLVFAKVRKEESDQLLMGRYDLASPGWLQPLVELENPPDTKTFHAIVNQYRIYANMSSSANRTSVIFQVTAANRNQQLLAKRLDADATQWDDGPWELLDEIPYHRKVLATVPMRSDGTAPYYVFFQDYGYAGTLLYKIYGYPEYPQLTYFDGSPSTQGASPYSAGQFRGAVLWPQNDEVFVFWQPNGGGGVVQTLRLLPPDVLPFDPVPTLEAFDEWLFHTASVRLESVPASIPRPDLNLLQLLTLPANDSWRAALGDVFYQAHANQNIGSLGAYVEGRLRTPGSEAERATFDLWQLADRIVRANTQPALTIAGCVRRLFARRFPNAPVEPLALRRIGPVAWSSQPALAGLESVAIDGGQPDQVYVAVNPGLALPLGPAVDLTVTYRDPNGVDILHATFRVDPATNQPVPGNLSRIVPRELPSFPCAGAVMDDVALALRRDHVRDRYLAHLTDSTPNLAYFEEYYYFVPLQLALELQRNGHYVAALDWFRSVYDYTQPPGAGRKIWYGLLYEESLTSSFVRMADWLLDPLNPHAIAKTRLNAYTRFTLLSLLGCLLEYADSEFTRDNAESLERARVLYLTALELLDEPQLQQRLDRCAERIGNIEVDLADAANVPTVERMREDLARLTNIPQLNAVVERVQAVLARAEDDDTRISSARDIVDAAIAGAPGALTFAQVHARRSQSRGTYALGLMANDTVTGGVAAVGREVAGERLHTLSLVTGIAEGELVAPGVNLAWLREPRVANVEARTPLDALLRTSQLNYPFSPGHSYQFCIPPNPVLAALRWHAEINLHKLRTCRNIAGLRRQVEPYAAATDKISGLPYIGSGGQLVLPGALTMRPTPYRYETLIARARELVQLAAQIEASMLAAIEKGEAELYQQLRAGQDVRLTRAGVRLQDLRVREAEGGVELAELQQARAQFQVERFQELLDEGFILFEHLSLGLQIGAASSYALAAGVAALAFNKYAESFSWAAQSVQTTAAIMSQYASYERRRQDWEYQRDLGQWDVRLGAQQVSLAQDHLQVVGQERGIAKLQTEHAEQTVEFLSNKFNNADLYDWMSDVLEGVYRFFLQQATATAKLALAQLAFERQEAPPPFILDDYWEAPGEGDFSVVAGGNAPNRRGLTGSARLLRDLLQVDQFAFDTRERKLELSHTISLARQAPIEFARFWETGVLPFSTPMELFDRAFPGHYMRQVKRVRVTVIALIPAVVGIRATLTSSRISRIVIGPEIFQTVRIERGPEHVALTSARDATGVLDLEPQSDLLRPFEGIGVDTNWEFRMPRAANAFDYTTIADVQVTLDYTALNSFDYREQVIRDLPPAVSADRPYSFRHQLSDQWYDLHNPELTAMPMTVRFRTSREDFPPNLEDLTIEHVALYFARTSGASFEIEVDHLLYTADGATGSLGGGALSIDGIVSSRRNAPSWIPLRGRTPSGEWELELPNTAVVRDRFRNQEVQDMLFVVTYAGRTPGWPQ